MTTETFRLEMHSYAAFGNTGIISNGVTYLDLPKSGYWHVLTHHYIFEHQCFVTHACCIAAGVQSRLSVRLFVRALKGKRLELSAPILYMVGPRHAPTLVSKDQRSTPKSNPRELTLFAGRVSACPYDCNFSS